MNARFKDQAQFLGVYIREAHPSDGWWPIINKKAGVDVRQPRTTEERCKVALQCNVVLKMKMPLVVDKIDDKVGLAYSALLGANAAGAVIGGFLLEGRGWLPPRVSTAMISAILWCLAITGFALSTSYYVSLLLLFTAGVLNLTFSSMGQTIVQLLSPPQLRGRLIGLFAMASLGLKAFSGVTVGVLGGLIGVHWSLALSAMVLLTITVALFALMIPGQQHGEFS